MRHATLVIAALALGACRGERSDSRETGVFTLKPNPVKVTVTRDSTHSASAMVPATGGTITATGSDGSRFTLTIPPSALDQDTTITMTPVSAMEGLPLSGGVVAAVHFEPEGLRFNTPVRLTIEPARDIPPEQQAGISYLGEGDDLHLYPLERGQGTAMRLLHFSGGGIVSGTAAEVNALHQHPPADPTAQLEQQIARLQAEREARLAGEEGGPNFSDELAALLQNFYTTVVVPKLDAAKETDDWRVMFNAVQIALAFIRVSTMMGEDQSAFSRLLPVMEPILVRGFDRAYHRCIQKVGGDNEAGMLMIIARNAATTIFGVQNDDPRFPPEKIAECNAGGSPLPPHLVLSIESAFVFDNPNGTATMILGSTDTLDQVGGSTSYQTRGWAPITYRDLHITPGTGCSSYADVKTGDGLWKVQLMVHPDGKIGMTWNFKGNEGRPTEIMTIVPCPGGGGHRYQTEAHWWSACLNQISSQAVEQAIEQGKGYVGLPTGMTLFPAPGMLEGMVKAKDFLCKEGTISLRLKVLP